MDTSRLDAIIFDLGGVIINIDYHRTIEAFENLGFKDFRSRYTQAEQSDIFDEIETGAITEDQFRKGVRRMGNSAISDLEIDTAWNLMLLDLPEERLRILEKLRKTHRTFLLSNTNSIHVRSFTQTIKDQHGIESLKPYFEQVHFSHEMKLRKPDTTIFQKLIDEHDLNPADTLFIDDSIQHISGAKKVGLQTHHLKAPETIVDLFG